MITQSELLAVLEEILETGPGSVRADSDLEQLGWDSLADLNLISLADERYGVVVDPKALAASTSPADVLALFPAAA